MSMRTPKQISLAAIAAILLLCATPALAAKRPAVDEQSVSALTQTSAILNATINPQGEATTYHFQYITQTEFEAGGYANATSVPVPDAQAGSARGEVVVGQQVTGLEPGTAYRYRVIATNPIGAEEGQEGEDQTFTTPPPLPPIATTTAVNVSQNAATLTATIDARGLSTTYEFDIGADTSYGTRVFGQATPVEGAQPYTVTLQNLAAGTIYHYRVIATNAYGTSYGADEAFTTPAYPAVLITAPVTLPLLPAPLIAPAPAAKPVSAKSAARTARHSKAKTARKRKRRSQRSHAATRHATPAKGE